MTLDFYAKERSEDSSQEASITMLVEGGRIQIFKESRITNVSGSTLVSGIILSGSAPASGSTPPDDITNLEPCRSKREVVSRC